MFNTNAGNRALVIVSFLFLHISTNPKKNDSLRNFIACHLWQAINPIFCTSISMKSKRPRSSPSFLFHSFHSTLHKPLLRFQTKPNGNVSSMTPNIKITYRFNFVDEYKCEPLTDLIHRLHKKHEISSFEEVVDWFLQGLVAYR